MNSTMVEAPGRFFGSILKHDDISALSGGFDCAGILIDSPDLASSYRQLNRND